MSEVESASQPAVRRSALRFVLSLPALIAFSVILQIAAIPWFLYVARHSQSKERG